MEPPRKNPHVEIKQQLFHNYKLDFINCLDNDSLAQIFMLLSIPERLIMGKVCLKWKEASKLAWYNITKYKCGNSIGLVPHNELLTQSYVEKLLLRCGSYLRELSLSYKCDSSVIKIIGIDLNIPAIIKNTRNYKNCTSGE